ncbi:hypothetical protein [Zestomonas carbonaria]|uniref:Uncharacterized protein n=1 Tax=Zestomonas carbonaria TaxID=2762745 RepID=A0A7U7I9D6_9GAMM|nr:hypothetical protein [Pseudomonas carbonaria]CAD5108190.1 hypothetical protein PSEWESI4_02475 [Pseudomonas carbonaria]
MKTLFAIATTLVLATSAMADDQRTNQRDGKGLYPEWLLTHQG